MKHKSKKETKTLSDWRKTRAIARNNRRVAEMIKEFREQMKALTGINPF